MNLFPVANAADQAGAAQPQGADWSMLVIMVVVFLAMMYFVSIKPGRKAQKQKEEMLSKIGVGDEVMLRSGMCGRVREFKADSDYAVIDISSGVSVTFAKDVIVHILPKGTISAIK